MWRRPAGRIGARPISRRPAVPDERADAGAGLTTPEQFGKHRVARPNPDWIAGCRVAGMSAPGRPSAPRTRTSEGRLNSEPRRSRSASISPPARQRRADRCAGSSANFDRLSQRFPPGLKYLVNYDTTTFVQATIHDVADHAVNRLCVGRDRRLRVFSAACGATLIPAIAGASQCDRRLRGAAGDGDIRANTISLLAVVLAIGILVDGRDRGGRERPNASWRKNRTCHQGTRTKKAMIEITAPIIAIHVGPSIGISCRLPSSPEIAGTLFRQFAVTISVAMLISAVNALTLSPALVCGVFLRHGRPEAGPDGLGTPAHRQYPRRLCGDPLRRLVRVSVLGLVAILASAAGVLFFCPCETPTGFFSRKKTRALSLSMCSCRTGASVSRTRGTRSSGSRGRAEADAAGPERFRDRRIFDHRRRQRVEYGALSCRP